MPIPHAFNDWECKYCHQHYKLELVCLGCEKSHEIVYVPFSKPQLKNLIQFIYVKDENLLDPEMIKTLKKYSYNMKGSEA